MSRHLARLKNDLSKTDIGLAIPPKTKQTQLDKQGLQLKESKIFDEQ